MKLKQFITTTMMACASVITWAQDNFAEVTGSYYADQGIDYRGPMGNKKQKDGIELTFVDKENGKIENRIDLNCTGGKLKFYLNESLYNKQKLALFKSNEMQASLIMIDKNVFAILESDKLTDVLAKDKSMLSTYDLETAKAKYEDLKRKQDGAAADAAKQKMMNFAAYKENVGKVVFATNWGLFYPPEFNTAKEDPKQFLKSTELGKSIAAMAYFDKNPVATCGKTCQFNYEYEILGQKKDRKSNQSKSRAWSNMVKDKEVINDYKFLGAHSLYNDPDNMWDATWVDLLHSVKDQLKAGQSYNFKMTVYTWKDGANQEKLAEGTIALQITASSLEWLNKVIGWKEEKENQ